MIGKLGRLVSSVAFARTNAYVAFAIATPVACSVNARCEADAHVYMRKLTY